VSRDALAGAHRIAAASATRDKGYTGAVGNLTVAIDDELLQRARQRAVANGTSVNALVREYLTAYAGDDEMEQRREFVELARRLGRDLKYSERTWTRDDLYDRDALR